MNIILITKPDIEIIVIQEHLLCVYVCYSLDIAFLWKIYNCNKNKDVVGQESMYIFQYQRQKLQAGGNLYIEKIICIPWRLENTRIINLLFNFSIF